MIIYNTRYMGPYEYDKFILNIFQLSNEIDELEDQLKNKSGADLLKLQTELDDYFNAICENNLLQYILLLSYQLE